MGVDTRVLLMYGYKVDNMEITDAIEDHANEDELIEVNGTEYDPFDYLYEVEDDELAWIDDTMCGEYQVVGIMYADVDADEDTEIIEFDKSINFYDDEKLDKHMKEKFPFFVGKEYKDGKLFGKEPKLYFVVHKS